MADDDDDHFPSHSGSGSSYDLNSKIMISAIISLSFVVLLVTLLHIYARCVLRRQARRQAALRRLGFAIPTSAGVHILDHSKTGLDPTVIAALPVFVPNGAASMECSVCLSAIEDGEIARNLPNCKHSFHVECIDKWLATNSTCPICRTEAEPKEGMAGVPPSAPPLEGTYEAKINGSGTSRLSSFRRMLSGERSSRRVQSCDALSDLERQ